MTEAPRTGMAPWQIKTVLTVLLTGQLLSALDQTIVGTALPTIVGELGGMDDLSLVVTAYLLTSTVSTALYGKLSDLYGAKPVYIAAIAIFTAGSLLVVLSQDMTQMTIFRGVQGLGAGGLVTMSFTISATVLPPRELGRVQGWVGAMYALASLVGPLAGGLFTEYLSWQWCFAINVPLGVVAIAALVWMLKLPPAPRGGGSVDYLGATLLVAGVSALMMAALWGGTRYAWTSPLILAMIAAGVLLGVLFVARQLRAPEPLVPMSILRRPDVSMAMIITFVVGVAMFGAYVFLPVYLQVVRGEEPTAAGLHLLPMMIAVMIGSGASGWLIAALLGRMKIFLILGTGLMAVSLYLLSTLDARTPIWVLWAYEVVMGIGMGMVISKLIIAVQNSVSRRDIGTITAQAAFYRIIGASIGTAAFGAVFTAQLTTWQQRLLGGAAPEQVSGGARILYEDPAAIRALRTTDPQVYGEVVEMFARSVQSVFLVAVPVMVVAFLLTWFLPDTRLRGYGDETAEQPTGSKGSEGVR